MDAGAHAIITGNTITNAKGVASDGSDSAGILVDTAGGPGSEATISNNFTNGNSYGIGIGDDSSDTSTLTVSNNDISGNTGGRHLDPWDGGCGERHR